MAIAAAALAFLCFTLFVLLIGRHRGANREETRLQQIANDLGEKWLIERQKVRHLQECVTRYRGDLSRLAADNGELMAALTVEPSLTEAVYATLAELPLTDPEDIR